MMGLSRELVAESPSYRLMRRDGGPPGDMLAVGSNKNGVGSVAVAPMAGGVVSTMRGEWVGVGRGCAAKRFWEDVAS